jgi:hypothetical protein
MRREQSQEVVVQLIQMVELLDSLQREARVMALRTVQRVYLVTEGKTKRELDADQLGPETALSADALSMDAAETVPEALAFPRLYAGTKGRRLSVRLLRDEGASVSSEEDAMHPPSCPPVAFGELDTEERIVAQLPALTSEEVHQLVSTVVSIPQMKNGMHRVSGLESIDDNGAVFELVCGTAKDAHFVGRRLTEHRLVGPGGVPYTMNVIRSISLEEEEKDEAERKLRVSDAPMSKWRGKRALEREAKRGHGLDKINTTEEEWADQIDTFASEDEGELMICDQCHDIVDHEYSKRTLKTWIRQKDGSLGMACECHGGLLFCNDACLEKHLEGEEPSVPSKGVHSGLQGASD